MGNISRNGNPKNHKGNAQNQKHCNSKVKDDFDGFISRLDTAEQRLSKLEDMSVETSQTEKQREKKALEHNFQELWYNYKRCNMCIMGITHVLMYMRREKRINIWNKNNRISQTTYSRNSENTRQNKCQNIYTEAYHIQTEENQGQKVKILPGAREKSSYLYQE